MKTTIYETSRSRRALTFLLMFWCIAAQAQLAVTVSPPRITGNKAVVTLALKNDLTERVESARAVVFLMDEQGKMIAQDTRWVIGGTAEKAGLAVGATNAFYFVITSNKLFTTTNLTPKVTFSRVVLKSGKLADIAKDVQIHVESK